MERTREREAGGGGGSFTCQIKNELQKNFNLGRRCPNFPKWKTHLTSMKSWQQMTLMYTELQLYSWFGGGVFYVRSKMNSKKITIGGGGVSFTSDQKWTPKKFQLGGVWNLTFDTKSKYERIVRFKPSVYLAYFRSYGHLTIAKYTAMYQKCHF